MRSVEALVLTHNRVHEATATMQILLEDFPMVTLVVNGAGGVDMPRLSRPEAVRTIHLATNEGPAVGYREGLLRVVEQSSAEWVLVCEDDLSVASPPRRDLEQLLERIDRYEASFGVRVGAVCAYARQLSSRWGTAIRQVPMQTPLGLLPADVAAWGATLVRRDVVVESVLPDGDFFFGYEDFDWFLRVRRSGFEVLLDTDFARCLGERVARLDEDGQPRHDDLRAWRLYYSTREFFRFQRRHGPRRWLWVHLVRSCRRAHLSDDPLAWRAVAAGAWDGARGVTGRNERWLRRA